ncbi:MAG: TIGR03557 family F420-dependent LLM class oxidoreductase [Deltaproteobacteria bacterium]|nr:TIGR03557 family F420-dependent LLM class oxidoreductase [Deltaproteobacteria bacterium]
MASFELGYALSSEEHDPLHLVRWAQRAEAAGFQFALISDHYHPWIDQQGQSPFVWSVIGAIAQATTTLRLGTGVTCPIARLHPAIIAQAAATAACLMPDRFFLGVGSGENLNEHVIGAGWPAPTERQAMLAEAISVLRLLWQGGEQSHCGEYFVVDQARLYTLPSAPPPLYVAASTAASAELAGHAGDGMIGTAPEPALVAAFAAAGGKRKPRYGQLTVCVAGDDSEARRIAHRWWPTAALAGNLSWEIKTPGLFAHAVKTVREEDVAESIVCGPDVRRHADGIQKFLDAGYDHVYVHQVGPDQEGFFRFYEERVLPEFRQA